MSEPNNQTPPGNFVTKSDIEQLKDDIINELKEIRDWIRKEEFTKDELDEVMEQLQEVGTDE